MSTPSRTMPAASGVSRAECPAQARPTTNAGTTKPGRLTRRADYVATAKGRRFHSDCLSLQAAERPPVEDGREPARARFGLTVSRKVGNSVVRSRVKRRLREAIRRIEAAGDGTGWEAARPTLPDGVPNPGYDYVIVARTPALTRSFDALVNELAADLAGVHQSRRAARSPSPGDGPGPRPFRTRGKGPSSETR